jgi:purine-nucleoside phosphorylase
MPEIQNRITAALEYIKSKTQRGAEIGLVLGSGLGDFVDDIEDTVVIPFDEIPHFPKATVQGHAGAFVIGSHQGKRVVALKGRLHYYEGYTQQEITIPIRVMKGLGVKTVLLTNAAGGINLNFSSGMLMLICDHINYSGQNPLIGANLDEYGPRFPDMSDIYTKALRNALKTTAQEENIALGEGVYAMYSGPSYETPAEIRFFRSMGADAVGMSTVPEAIVASHCGMRVIGISCITNMAAGVLDRKLDHAEVVETANRVKNDFCKLLRLAVKIA